ncbi:MAG TPA: choice-of-anchor tandem repeat GloVer-containing protein [Rhizomicrobium sp.]|jgi:hypothetical protein|nr:choice-of-anchor tandem repeat GloVer-containing protein [Rhizomicrobium sp.]
MPRDLARYLLCCVSALGVLVSSDGAQAKTKIYQVLHSFNNNAGGNEPVAGLIEDANGNFYGTTAGTRMGEDGTVFILPAGSKKPKFLHTFTGGGTDGSDPYAGVIMDKAGNLYGTTVGGGDGGPARERSTRSIGKGRKRCSIPSTEEATAPFLTPVWSWIARAIFMVRLPLAGRAARA